MIHAYHTWPVCKIRASVNTVIQKVNLPLFSSVTSGISCGAAVVMVVEGCIFDCMCLQTSGWGGGMWKVWHSSGIWNERWREKGTKRRKGDLYIARQEGSIQPQYTFGTWKNRYLTVFIVTTHTKQQKVCLPVSGSHTPKIVGTMDTCSGRPQIVRAELTLSSYITTHQGTRLDRVGFD